MQLAWHGTSSSRVSACWLPCPVRTFGGTGLINIAIVNGIRCLVQAEFTPVGVLEAIENGATHMFIVPAALQMVVQHPQAKETDFFCAPLSHVRRTSDAARVA